MFNAHGMNDTDNLHASCISHHGKGLLILGASGAGKSTLAMQLIALGAQLVADDRCCVFVHNETLHARAPETIAGLIEARGLGILRLPFLAHTPITACIELGRPLAAQPERLPAPRSRLILGASIEILDYQPAAHFPSLLMCYLMGVRSE